MRVSAGENARCITRDCGKTAYVGETEGPHTHTHTGGSAARSDAHAARALERVARDVRREGRDEEQAGLGGLLGGTGAVERAAQRGTAEVSERQREVVRRRRGDGHVRVRLGLVVLLLGARGDAEGDLCRR